MKILFTCLLFVNIAGFLAFGIDKYKAIHNKWRIRESMLMLFALLGGGPGCLLGMYLFHHKTRHRKFTIGIPVILTIDLLLGCAAAYFYHQQLDSYSAFTNLCVMFCFQNLFSAIPHEYDTFQIRNLFFISVNSRLNIYSYHTVTCDKCQNLFVYIQFFCPLIPADRISRNILFAILFCHTFFPYYAKQKIFLFFFIIFSLFFYQSRD